MIRKKFHFLCKKNRKLFCIIKKDLYLCTRLTDKDGGNNGTDVMMITEYKLRREILLAVYK